MAFQSDNDPEKPFAYIGDFIKGWRSGGLSATQGIILTDEAYAALKDSIPESERLVWDDLAHIEHVCIKAQPVMQATSAMRALIAPDFRRE